ncbi:FtsX-like permease family protein [Actinomadura alba]|uniref:FtsX-like permease family protein n=1 Tax=Actinomadura alba TaxID=406431 RepID=A0ABR7LX01_9ACTN|nr:FtsX-like permease family protein [Actinomadura alba]MBC6469384.1 FtsX-like permease family protein [Actinomadura alba]
MMSRFSGLAVVWAGIWRRRGMSAAVFLIAATAVAAASIGPSYHDAAATYITRTTMAEAPASSQGILLTRQRQQGPPITPSMLSSYADLALDGSEHLFERPIREMEFSGVIPGRTNTSLSWRDGVCAQLTILRGRCATRAGEIVVSAAALRDLRWTVGSRAPSTLRGVDGQRVTLTVVGVYSPKNSRAAYWFGSSVDPAQQSQEQIDPFFAAETTALNAALLAGADTPAFMGRVLLLLRTDRLTAHDLEAVGESVRRITSVSESHGPTSRFNSTVADTIDEAHTAIETLSVSILMISAQLVVLCCLLLFFVVIDVAEARTSDVALVKLRGLSGIRLITFWLAEPISLLAAAVPAGLLAGRLAATTMSAALFGPRIPVGAPGELWLAVGLAAAGGLAAVVLASRAALIRPVTEQFRRAGTGPPRRGWVPDAVVITLTAGGLVQIAGAGTLRGPGRQDAISLLVPGLLAISVALVAARTLPPACRALFRHSRRRRGIGLFLALRQVARRPGGVRTTVTLTTAFTLVVFAVAAWSTARANHRAVAATQVGAPVALTITPPPSESLAAFVRTIDPGGRAAAGVLVMRHAESGAPVTIGVDPDRFAHVAYWRPDFADTPLRSLLPRLRSPSAPAVRLSGDQMRIGIEVKSLTVNGGPVKDHVLGLHAELAVPGQSDPVDLPLGSLPPAGEMTSVVRLPRCMAGCELRLMRFKYGTTASPPVFNGHIVIRAIEERAAGAWRPVDAGLTEPGRWRTKQNRTGQGTSTASVGARPDGMNVGISIEAGTFPGIEPASFPTRLPAITTAGMTERPLLASGSDALDFPIDRVAVARALPAGAGNGLLVDGELARRAGVGVVADRTEYQIWVTAKAAEAVKARVRAARVRLLAERRAEDVARDLGRRGPGLALTLMLADTAVVAALAVAGVMLSLYTSGRRRSYEMAALNVAGARRRALRRGLLTEQGIVLGHGLLVGVGAGLAVVWLALPAVPQFSRPPAAPPLHYAPDPVLLGGVIAATAALVAAGAWLSTVSIMRRIGAEQLREQPP